MAKKKILPDLIVTELILVKADWNRTFVGTIRREVDTDGNPVVLGEVIVQEGTIWSKAANQEELMKNMDAICLMKLDKGLHLHSGFTSQIFGENFFLN
jgi:hypothetical protein